MEKKKRGCGTGVIIMILILFVVGGAKHISPEIYTGSGTASSSVSVSSLRDFSKKNYKSIEVKQEQIFQGELILVNAENSYRDGTKASVRVFDEKNKCYKVKDKSVTLNKNVMPPLNRMMNDFRRETGLGDVLLLSGYRSEEEQEEILKEKIEAKGKAEALKWAAAPGYSEHHTGYAFDLSIYHDGGRSETFRGQGEYRWISENCSRYGFVVRYSADKTKLTGIQYEPWHLRYIGVPHAALLTQKGFCLEEYMEYLKGYSFDSEHLMIKTGNGKKYEVYYVAASKDVTKVPVPKNKAYTISGDNAGGFIVTCEL